jgi:hypothetical protein
MLIIHDKKVEANPTPRELVGIYGEITLLEGIIQKFKERFEETQNTMWLFYAQRLEFIKNYLQEKRDVQTSEYF